MEWPRARNSTGTHYVRFSHTQDIPARSGANMSRLTEQSKMLQFPGTKNILWDHTAKGSGIQLHLGYYRSPKVKVLDNVLRLALRHLDNTRDSQYSCILIGALTIDEDGQGITINLDRFDRGRHNAGVLCPTTQAPGDVLVPFRVCRKLQEDNQNASETYHSAIKLVHHRCVSKDAIDVGSFLVSRGSVCCPSAPDSSACQVQFDVVCPSSYFLATPITPVPIVQTALSKNLAGPMSLHHIQGEPKTGYLTMDHTRKLLLVLESDPKACSLPLVGIWISGCPFIYSPFVWACCQRYLTNQAIQDRVCEPPEPFLLVLYNPLHSKPEFYECTTRSKKSDLDYSLYTCCEKFQLPKNGSNGELKFAELDTSVVRDGPKLEPFTAAQQLMKNELPGRENVTEKNGEHKFMLAMEDITPRVMPTPQPAQKPVIDNMVPDVSLMFHDNDKSMVSNYDSRHHYEKTQPPMPSGNQPVKGCLKNLSSTTSNTTDHMNFLPDASRGRSVPTTVSHGMSSIGQSAPEQLYMNAIRPQGPLTQSQNTQHVYSTTSMQSPYYIPQPHGRQPFKLQRAPVPAQYYASGPRTIQPGHMPRFYQQHNNTGMYPMAQQMSLDSMPRGNSQPHMPQWQQSAIPQDMQPSHSRPGWSEHLQRAYPPRQMAPTPVMNPSHVPRGQIQSLYHPQSIQQQVPSVSSSQPLSANAPYPHTIQRQHDPQHLQSQPVKAVHFQSGPQFNLVSQGQMVSQNIQNAPPVPYMGPSYQPMYGEQRPHHPQPVFYTAHPQVTESTGSHHLQVHSKSAPHAHTSPHAGIVQLNSGIPQVATSIAYSQENDRVTVSEATWTDKVHMRNGIPYPPVTSGMSHGEAHPKSSSGTIGDNSSDFIQLSSSLTTPRTVSGEHVISTGSISQPRGSGNLGDNSCRSSQDSGLSVTPDRPISNPGSAPTSPRATTAGNLPSLSQLTDSPGFDKVPPEVYQLLMQQDTQLKLMQAQIQELLKLQSPQVSAQQSPSISKSSVRTCSVAINTSVFQPNMPSGSHHTDQGSTTSVLTSPVKTPVTRRIVSPVGPIEGMPPSQSGSTTPAEVRHRGPTLLNSTAKFDSGDVMVSNGDLTTVMNNIGLHEKTDDSIQSDMIVDLPSYHSSPTRSRTSRDDISESPISASMIEQQREAEYSDESEEGEVNRVSEQEQKEYYDQLMVNIHKLLKSHSGEEEDMGVTIDMSRVHAETAGQSNSYSRLDLHAVLSETFTPSKDGGTSRMTCEEDRLNSLLRFSNGVMPMDTTFIPKINYVSMFLDSDNDTSMEINAMAMKYLKDEQLTQMAKLRTAAGLSGMKSGKNAALLRQVLAGDQRSTPNVTQYGMSPNDMTFATRKYMEKYGLLNSSNCDIPWTNPSRNEQTNPSHNERTGPPSCANPVMTKPSPVNDSYNRSRAEVVSSKSDPQVTSASPHCQIASNGHHELYESYLNVMNSSGPLEAAGGDHETQSRTLTPGDKFLAYQMRESLAHKTPSMPDQLQHPRGPASPQMGARPSGTSQHGQQQQSSSKAMSDPELVGKSQAEIDNILDVRHLKQLPKLL